MPFGFWARVQHAPTCLMTLLHELCENGWTDWDAIWVVDSGWPKEACISGSPDPPCEGAIINGMDMPGMTNDTLLWAVQKWLNQLICHLDCGLRWAEGSTCSVVFARWHHWRHLANTIEPSVCRCDAALCQITLTTCYYLSKAFSALALLPWCQEEHPSCKNWVMERGANNLHMVELMPLPPNHLLLHWNPEWFNLSGAGLS